MKYIAVASIRAVYKTPAILSGQKSAAAQLKPQPPDIPQRPGTGSHQAAEAIHAPRAFSIQKHQSPSPSCSAFAGTDAAADADDLAAPTANLTVLELCGR